MTIEKGKTLGIKALALAEDLTANGEKEVFFELNGQLRSVFIQDKDASKVSGLHEFPITSCYEMKFQSQVKQSFYFF